jgi:hypothetical protein
MTATLTLYAVRNREGKWFRAKGYGGYGDTWTPDIGKAKLYSKIARARAEGDIRLIAHRVKIKCA